LKPEGKRAGGDVGLGRRMLVITCGVKEIGHKDVNWIHMVQYSNKQGLL
jgi:hypothetical protein